MFKKRSSCLDVCQETVIEMMKLNKSIKSVNLHGTVWMEKADTPDPPIN